MDFIINIFNIVLYRPIFNALILLYQYLPGNDFGIAIIILTLVIRFILYPTFIQSIKSQKAMSEIQSKIQELQKKYKGDREKQAMATIELYKKSKVNPFSGCLPLLIQFPVLIAMFKVFQRGFQEEQLIANLYHFIRPIPETINTYFLGIINLSESASTGTWLNIFLVFLVGIFQFIQTKMVTSNSRKKGKQEGQKTAGFANMMQKQMLYFFPVLMVFIFWGLPSALSLYIMIGSLFTIAQQHFLFKKQTKESILIK